ncbi:MAG: ABC transporter ATP-binding protein, partial [Anaerolineae bacterium]|nr:ABC transporter ATP-binding protein [Anaerolineae bacterium]
VILLVAPQLIGQYWNYTMGTVGIYVLLGLGLNIVVGLAGLLDLGYVAFFAIGAYTMGLLTAPEPHGLMLNF